MVLLWYLVLVLALTGHSSALYCVCKDGVGDQALQKALDYACGAGADCTPIAQNGACFQPNTVKDHCSYAVNSYFQKKGQAQGSCDFAGTATISQNAPASSSGCVFPSSASSSSSNSSTGMGTGTATPTTPSTSPTTPSTSPTSGITGTTPSTTTPTTPTSTPTGTGTGTGTSSPMFGISPTATTTTGTGTGFNNDSSKGVALLQSTVLSLPLSLLVFCLMSIFRV